MTPPVINNDEVNQPTLKDGYTVLQVVRLVEYSGYSEEEAAERLSITRKSIEDALEYYWENTDEIESLRKEEQDVAEEYRYEGSV